MIEKILLEEVRKENINKVNVEYTGINEADKLLCDFDNYPHAYLLACIGDRQYDSKKVWEIPYRIKNILGSFEINFLNKLSVMDWENLFVENNLHRFNREIARCYYNAIKKIMNEYDGNAANIWNNEPSSATVILRMLDFDGVGIKIATMTANILARDFNIKYSDYCSIDISVDTHVKRVFKRMGFVKNVDDVNECIYKAREICPTYPGILDGYIWEFGRKICTSRNPKCEICIFKSECPKNKYDN